jgi:hypothetical protein
MPQDAILEADTHQTLNPNTLTLDFQPQNCEKQISALYGLPNLRYFIIAEHERQADVHI